MNELNDQKCLLSNPLSYSAIGCGVEGTSPWYSEENYFCYKCNSLLVPLSEVYTQKTNVCFYIEG